MKSDDNMKYRHIGYYNDIEDVVTLFNATPDEIVEYKNNNFGVFYECSVMDIDTDNIHAEDKDIIKFTTDKEYIVVKDFMTDSTEYVSESDFIDIYKLVK